MTSKSVSNDYVSNILETEISITSLTIFKFLPWTKEIF